MPEQEKAKKQEEPWLRQHKIGVSAIILSLLIGILSLAGTWLRFPTIARLLNLEFLLKEDVETQIPGGPESENINSEVLVREFTCPGKSKAGCIIVRVTKPHNSPSEFEFFHKKTDAKPFQSFKYDVEVEDVKFDDLNFDGHPDVLLQTSHSVCCIGYTALIYNSHQKSFYPNENLNKGLTFTAGYELDRKAHELDIYYHCPPNNAKTTYRIQTDYEGEVSFEPVRYYDIDISSGKETEVESIESVCSP
jgi:hypothetical protein